MYIRQSTLLTILRLSKPAAELTYITASSSLSATIGSQVLSPRSINYVIKILRSYCDTIAIGDTKYRYEFIWTQLSTNRFMSPRASESALSDTHQVSNGLMIAANNRSLKWTILYWSLIYCHLQLSCLAIYWTQSVLCHSAHMNPNFNSPVTHRLQSK